MRLIGVTGEALYVVSVGDSVVDVYIWCAYAYAAGGGVEADHVSLSTPRIVKCWYHLPSSASGYVVAIIEE